MKKKKAAGRPGDRRRTEAPEAKPQGRQARLTHWAKKAKAAKKLRKTDEKVYSKLSPYRQGMWAYEGG